MKNENGKRQLRPDGQWRYFFFRNFLPTETSHGKLKKTTTKKQKREQQQQQQQQQQQRQQQLQPPIGSGANSGKFDAP